MEGFSVMVNKAVDMNMLEGFQFGVGSQIVSHLQFADDTLLVCKKAKRNIWAIKAILQLFEVLSGLKVNFHKSQLMGINVDDVWLYRATFGLNCKVGSIPFNYLGLPVGANLKRLSTWAPVVMKVRDRLSVWRNKRLGGRIVLLKSVLTTLSIYYLSFFTASAGWLGLSSALQGECRSQYTQFQGLAWSKNISRPSWQYEVITCCFVSSCCRIKVGSCLEVVTS